MRHHHHSSCGYRLGPAESHPLFIQARSCSFPAPTALASLSHPPVASSLLHFIHKLLQLSYLHTRSSSIHFPKASNYRRHPTTAKKRTEKEQRKKRTQKGNRSLFSTSNKLLRLVIPHHGDRFVSAIARRSGVIRHYCPRHLRLWFVSALFPEFISPYKRIFFLVMKEVERNIAPWRKSRVITKRNFAVYFFTSGFVLAPEAEKMVDVFFSGA